MCILHLNMHFFRTFTQMCDLNNIHQHTFAFYFKLFWARVRVIFIHQKETKIFCSNTPTDAAPYDSNPAPVLPELELSILQRHHFCHHRSAAILQWNTANVYWSIEAFHGKTGLGLELSIVSQGSPGRILVSGLIRFILKFFPRNLYLAKSSIDH